MRHLPTARRGPAIKAQLGNNTHPRAHTHKETLQHFRAARQRPLASFGAQRSKAHPDLPTLKELGYDLTYYLWVGLFAPKGTPPAVVATLTAAIDKAAATPQFSAAIAKIGLEPSYLNAADFTKFWNEDGRRSDEAVQLIGKVAG
jgi:tripartite-type tricarboxylate transporter receptor subunit TctC